MSVISIWCLIVFSLKSHVAYITTFGPSFHHNALADVGGSSSVILRQRSSPLWLYSCCVPLVSQPLPFELNLAYSFFVMSFCLQAAVSLCTICMTRIRKHHISSEVVPWNDQSPILFEEKTLICCAFLPFLIKLVIAANSSHFYSFIFGK